MNYPVRVLGRVEVWVGGRPVQLAAQQTKALAMLVAAVHRGSLSRGELLDALWPTAPEADRLSPVISRLRQLLAECGLTVSTARGRHTYRLQASREETSLASTVDAVASEELASRAHELLDDGNAEAALAGFRSAMALWRGTPFDEVDDDWRLPRVCRDAQARWEQARSRLVRAWAVTALRHADLSANPVVNQLGWPTEDEPTDDAVWLLRFLATLRGDGVAMAEAMLESRGRDQLTTRAFHLMALHELGVAIDAAPPRGTPSADGGPRVLRLACPGTGDLQPWPDLAGRLWAAALRDLRAPAERWTTSRSARLLTDLVESGRGTPEQLAEPLATLLRQMGGDEQLTIRVEEIDQLGPPARELYERISTELQYSNVRCSAASIVGEPADPILMQLALGDACYDAGDSAAAEAAWLEAYVATTDPRLRAATLVRLARRWSEPGQVDRQLVALLEDGLVALGGAAGKDAEGWRLQLAAHLAHKLTMAVVEHVNTPEGRRGIALAHHALRKLSTVTDANTICEVLTECRWALFDCEPPARLVEFSECLDRVSTAGAAVDPRLRSEALIGLVVDRVRLGRSTAARAALEKHRTHAAAGRSARATCLQHIADTMLDLWDGNFATAEHRLGRWQANLDRLAPPSNPLADTVRQVWAGQVFWLHREQGQFAELMGSDVITAIERHGFFPVWVAGRALLYCEIDRPEDAADQVAALLVETGDLAGLPSHGWAVPTFALLAEVCAGIVRSGTDVSDRLDINALLARLHGLLLPHLDEVALAGWPTVLLTPVARSLGLLQLAAGDPLGALDRFDRAERLVGSARPQLARLRFDRVRALILAGGAVDEVARLLRSTRSTAADLGMLLLAHEAGQLLSESA
ncbi:MAG: hypothetical protein JO115_20430 [Pseudonocardiales bacterium]|nr:hypothetical protein [Pseudonocardiales bacterium]